MTSPSAPAEATRTMQWGAADSGGASPGLGAWPSGNLVRVRVRARVGVRVGVGVGVGVRAGARVRVGAHLQTQSRPVAVSPKKVWCAGAGAEAAGRRKPQETRLESRAKVCTHASVALACG